MIKLKGLEEFKVKGKRVLVRCDFNVPIHEGIILDDTRITSSLKTIRYLINNNAKIILISHLGRPKGKVNEKYSLSIVKEHLEKLLSKKISFSSLDSIKIKNQINNLGEGEILLLENIRFFPGEEKNDIELSKKLASLGDIFINDAFATSHRSHASTVGITKLLPSGAGYLLEKEINNLNKILDNSKKPFIAIVGGSKVTDKIGIIKNLLGKIDTLIIGGKMAFAFLAAKGIEVGKSNPDENDIEIALNVMRISEEKGIKITLPFDFVVSDNISEIGEVSIVTKIEDNKMGLDIGPMTIKEFEKTILGASTLIWTGPMGVFEMEKFAKGTFSIAKAVASCSGTTVVGGGETIAAIKKAGYEDNVTHISTGGGAFITFLSGKEMPALSLLSKKEVEYEEIK